MNILKTTRQTLEALAPGKLIAYSDFAIPQDRFLALAKALSLLCKEGVIRRLVKGVYYKPEITEYGELGPYYTTILEKALAMNKGKVSYLTGNNVYNAMGLTTQLSRYYIIATDRPRTTIKIGPTEIHFVKSYVTSPTAHVELLQVLDAISDINRIPDGDIDRSCTILLGKVKRMSVSEKRAMVKLSLSYPPSTRALLGLFFEKLGENLLANETKSTLNTLSSYRIGLNEKLFPSKFNWKIV